tara:strand:- start:799 stop:1299 length:501 start_codon:yes stop_codon:yes gene_type:complete
MTNLENNIRIPNIPKKISLWDLVRFNYINDNQINPNGKVDDDVYESAVRNFIRDFGDGNRRLVNNNRPRTVPSNNRVREQRRRTNDESEKKQSGCSHVNNIRLMRDAINDNRKLQEKEKCCMCLTNNPTYIFLPCFHLCSCFECADKVNTCPKCRTIIREKRRVWF